MQFQADLLGVPVDRPKVIESTAAGAAFLAGLGVGLWKTGKDVEAARRPDRVFKPRMKARDRDGLYAGWKDAVAG
jgi:glycerol kinase